MKENIFYSLVKDSSNTLDCWEWKGKLRKNKMGFIDGMDAHRYAYISVIGEIPTLLCVKHKCKNSLCVNPFHLYLEKKLLTYQERFDKYVIKFTDDEKCWGWKGGKDRDGYAKLGNKSGSRISYLINIGKIPKNLCVCHSCDNRECTNPKHLCLGTNQENTIDRDNKGRGYKIIPPCSKGINNGRAKLNEIKVREIRKLLEIGCSIKEISIKYKVTPAAIRFISNGITWAHV